MNRRRARASLPEPASPLDDEDLLRQILVRLPPHPSSLPCAAGVSRLWRRVVTDDAFLRSFRKRHDRSPPLLGFFAAGSDGSASKLAFDQALRLPADSVTVPCLHGPRSIFSGCRHGRALLLDRAGRRAIVWNPLAAGLLRAVALPPGFADRENGAVICAAAGDGRRGHFHAHGGECLSGAFKLVLVRTDAAGRNATRASVQVYRSDSGAWGNAVSAVVRGDPVCSTAPAVVVGAALHWSTLGGDILRFDLRRRSITVIRRPPGPEVFGCRLQILRMQDDRMGVAVPSPSGESIQLWARKPASNLIHGWVRHKTLLLSDILQLPCYDIYGDSKILGYSEDDNLIIVSISGRVFTIQLDSLEFKNLFARKGSIAAYYPYKGVYARRYPKLFNNH